MSEQWAETIVDKDLGWTLRAQPVNSAIVAVEAFEHVGEDGDTGAVLYERGERPSQDDYTADLDEARWTVRGTMKFDGYAEIQVNDRFCFGTVHEAEQIGVLFRRLYELANRHLENPIR